MPNKFNLKSEPTKLFLPKPGDKIICNNGEEFICRTKESLNEDGLATYLSAKNKIFAYREDHDKCYHKYEWAYWDAEGKACCDDHNIMEVIPQSSEVIDDKKEEVKEEPLYTLQEIKEAWDNSCDGWNDFKNELMKINNPEYKEYIRLKAIYE